MAYDWSGVFVRVAEALRQQAQSQPLPLVPVRLSVLELLERAVEEKLRTGQARESWNLLRQAGVTECEQLDRLTGRLEGAVQSLATLSQEMLALDAEQIEARAADLLRRQVQARRERAECLAGISAVLSGKGTAV